MDIDKLAVLLSKINLYIQALEKIKRGGAYIPIIYHSDTFKLELKSDYGYVVTNQTCPLNTDTTSNDYNTT